MYEDGAIQQLFTRGKMKLNYTGIERKATEVPAISRHASRRAWRIKVRRDHL